MSGFRFEQPGPQGASGLKRVLIPMRRILVRILRPMLVQMADALQSFSTRLEAVEKRLGVIEGRNDRQDDILQATIGFGWDHVATTRRLAALEDQVAKCLAVHALMRDADGQMTLAFPEHVTAEATALAS